MRLFVAIDIPDEVRRAVADYVRPLAAIRSGARWVSTPGMHVTVKFIGDIEPERLEPVSDALRAARRVGAIEITFRGSGFFPNPKHPKVFWAGIEAGAALAELAADLEQRLEPLGILREGRAFRPHLTLARFKSEEGLRELHAAIAALGQPEFGSGVAREFVLYESKLRPGGAEYSRRAAFPIEPAGADA
jgi:2'-5' RNA ligase